MSKTSRRTGIVRWSAHGLSAMVFLLLIVFILGEGIRGQEGLPSLFDVSSLAVIAMWVGISIAWKWNGIGGGLMLVGYLIFASINRSFLIESPFVLFPGIGGLYLYSEWRDIMNDPTSMISKDEIDLNRSQNHENTK